MDPVSPRMAQQQSPAREILREFFSKAQTSCVLLDATPTTIMAAQRQLDSADTTGSVYEAIRLVLEAHGVKDGGRVSGFVEWYDLDDGNVFTVVWLDGGARVMLSVDIQGLAY